MKLLIVGSRGIESFNLASYVPKETDLIISGGAGGVDTLAERYADEKRISKLILRPRYERYGRAAPLKRNEEMVELADEVLVIWDGRSRGALYRRICEKEKQKAHRGNVKRNRFLGSFFDRSCFYSAYFDIYSLNSALKSKDFLASSR